MLSFLRSIYRYFFFKKLYGSHKGYFESFDEAERKIKKKSGWAGRETSQKFSEAFIIERDLAKQNKHIYHVKKQINGGYLFIWDYPVIFWLNKIFEQKFDTYDLHDFGGNVGNHFYNYSKYINIENNIKNWRVIELPNMIDAGKILKDLLNPRPTLSFDSLENSHSEGCQVFLASSSLQYFKGDWIDKILLNYDNLPDFVIINRTPFSEEDHSIFTIQNGGTATYVNRIIPFKELDRLETLGYKLVDDWFDPLDTCIIPFNRTKVWYKGYIYSKQDILFE